MADNRNAMNAEGKRSPMEIEAADVKKEEGSRFETPEVGSPRSKSGWIGSSTE